MHLINADNFVYKSDILKYIDKSLILEETLKIINKIEVNVHISYYYV